MAGRTSSLAVSLLLLAMATVCALSAGVKTHSSTRYVWYNDPFQDKTRGGLLHHGKPSETKIDAANRGSAGGYGRDSRQFGSSGERARGDSGDVLAGSASLCMSTTR